MSQYKPNIRICHHDLYSWFNSFGICFHEHAMYEYYAFDYESVGPADHHMTAI